MKKYLNKHWEEHIKECRNPRGNSGQIPEATAKNVVAFPEKNLKRIPFEYSKGIPEGIPKRIFERNLEESLKKSLK